MSREAVGQLLDRWMNEPGFRDAVRADPEGGVRGSGLELDPDEWRAVGEVEWDLPDEELDARASKGA